MARRAKLPRLLRIREAAEMLSVHPATLRRWDKQGKLKAVRFGNRGDRRYRAEDILKIMNRG